MHFHNFSLGEYCKRWSQFFCSWSSADLELLSPVSTAVSSAECLALHLCADTQGRSMCPWTSKQLQNFDRPSKIPTTADKIFLLAKGKGRKSTWTLCSFCPLYTQWLFTSHRTCCSSVLHRTVHGYTKKSPNSRRLSKTTSTLERIWDKVYKRM